jgi:hypothetical protein
MNRGSADKNSLSAKRFEPSFLLDIAHCFKNRVVQLWGQLSSLGVARNLDGSSNTVMAGETTSTTPNPRGDEEITIIAPDTDIISLDSLAMTGEGSMIGVHNRDRDIASRLPYPRISGGIHCLSSCRFEVDDLIHLIFRSVFAAGICGLLWRQHAVLASLEIQL